MNIQYIGMDLSKGDDTTSLTIYPQHFFKEGDKVKIFPQTNKIRFVVDRIINNSTVTIKSFIRPSRGYAKHVRRIKQYG